MYCITLKKIFKEEMFLFIYPCFPVGGESRMKILFLMVYNANHPCKEFLYLLMMWMRERDEILLD